MPIRERLNVHRWQNLAYMKPVFFRDTKGEQFSLDVPSDSTIGQIKVLLGEHKGGDPSKIRLVFSTQILQDAQHIEDITFSEQDPIYFYRPAIKPQSATQPVPTTQPMPAPQQVPVYNQPTPSTYPVFGAPAISPEPKTYSTVPNNLNQAHIGQLLQMGLTLRQAEIALIRSYGNLEQAREMTTSPLPLSYMDQQEYDSIVQGILSQPSLYQAMVQGATVPVTLPSGRKIKFAISKTILDSYQTGINRTIPLEIASEEQLEKFNLLSPLPAQPTGPVFGTPTQSATPTYQQPTPMYHQNPTRITLDETTLFQVLDSIVTSPQRLQAAMNGFPLTADIGGKLTHLTFVKEEFTQYLYAKILAEVVASKTALDQAISTGALIAYGMSSTLPQDFIQKLIQCRDFLATNDPLTTNEIALMKSYLLKGLDPVTILGVFSACERDFDLYAENLSLLLE